MLKDLVTRLMYLLQVYEKVNKMENNRKRSKTKAICNLMKKTGLNLTEAFIEYDKQKALVLEEKILLKREKKALTLKNKIILKKVDADLESKQFIMDFIEYLNNNVITNKN